MTVRIVGVRHHSPACTAVVAHVLEEVQPDWVLIEGPSDMNGRLDEVAALDHTLPVALYHFLSGEAVHTSSYTPFCSTSPEWVALRWAATHSAEFRFVDLPSWSAAFHHAENRTADRVDRYGGVMRRLCATLGIDGSDAVWDHLFEQPDTPDDRLDRLDTYFAELRPDDADAPERDLAREAFMAACIAWAADEPGDVVVVCGGFHKPALDWLWPSLPPIWPDPPTRNPEDRTGTYVVPWSNRRLDSFAGYAAGMPSPGWYAELHAHGAEAGARRMLERAITRLRRIKHPVSAADRVAVEVQLAGLMSLRAHRTPTRTDVLDALCSALVKEALDVPPPWTERVGVRRGTDARLAALLETFRGNAVGRVDPRTPRPPLVHDVEACLGQVGLALLPSPGDQISLDLFEPDDLARSRVLHRLRVLRIPQVERQRGPQDPSAADRREGWAVQRTEATLPALLEASIWGGTLEDAALTRLLHDLRHAEGLGPLVQVLVSLLFTGLGRQAPQVLDAVRGAVQRAHDLGSLGAALRLLVDLWRHETVFVQAHDDVIGGLLTACLRRTLWVFESTGGTGADAGRQLGAIGLREVLRHTPVDPTDTDAALSMLHRRATDPTAPPDLRGAAVGLRAAFGEEIADETVRTVRGVPAEVLGDWLAGLFAVTRERLHEEPVILDALHARVGGLSQEDFIAALPGLRLAFAWFPPREREAVAGALLQRMDVDPVGGWALVQGAPHAEAAVAAQRLEADAARVLARYHLLERR